MKPIPIAVAVAAAVFSFNATAGGDAQAQGQNLALVKQAQGKLKEQGHDSGSPDGKLGPKTQAALKDFQSAKGLTQTGQLDQQTLAALGLEPSAAAGATSSTTEQKPQQAPVPATTKQ